MRFLSRLSVAIFALLLLFVATPSTLEAANADFDYQQVLDKEQSKFESKVKHFSAKKRAKLDRKLSKINKKLSKRGASEEISDGVGTGLIIILVGAVIALLGLTGVADILITIGLVVLVLGLIFWLLD